MTIKAMLQHLTQKFTSSKIAPLQLCEWGAHLTDRENPPATLVVTLTRPCACPQPLVGTCNGCVGVLLDRLQAIPVATRCESCGERNSNRITQVDDLL